MPLQGIEFYSFEGICLLCAKPKVNIIDKVSFQMDYFNIHCMYFQFPPGLESEICPTDLKGATFSLTLAKWADCRFADSIQTANPLVPFTHRLGQHKLCPYQ